MFTKKTYTRGEKVINEKDLTDKIYIVTKGNIKFVTDFEGVDNFKMLDLGPGSIINHRNIFIDSELFWFDAIATDNSIVYEVTKK